MPKGARVVIVTANILPGASINVPNDGEWFIFRKCLTENVVFTRDQESLKLPIARGDMWPGKFGDLYFTNNDPTRTEQIEVWVGEGDLPRIAGNGAASQTDAGSATALKVASAPIVVGAGATMQVLSAGNNQRGFYVMTSGAGAVAFASTSGDVSLGGAFLAANLLYYIGGTVDLWLRNPNGGSVTVNISIAKGT